MIKNKKAWVISASMGYGHERAAYALRDLAYGGIIVANNYKGMPESDKSLWRQTRRLYEAISRFKSVPVVGEMVFDVMDKLQSIPSFYPRRDLSQPTIQLRQVYAIIKKGVGKHLINMLIEKNKKLPLVTTFFQVALAAEEYDYPGEIYCVICDADCSRAWAPWDPKASRIKYFAPNGRVVERLMLYGIKRENIYLTGFPLPKELIGGARYTTIKEDLSRRIRNLDPKNIFIDKYKKTIADYLGKGWKNFDHKHPLTITFAVGGAGAQKSIGLVIAESFKKELIQNKLVLNLIAGTRSELVDFYTSGLIESGLKKNIGKNVNIIWEKDNHSYFKKLSQTLHTTDILWTKPSEMSFYTGLGLPIVMAPPIGSQEHFNRLWLKTVGGGISQNDPRYANEWLYDWLNSGGLAKVAWNGFLEAPTHGTYRIESIITGEKIELEKLPLIV